MTAKPQALFCVYAGRNDGNLSLSRPEKVPGCQGLRLQPSAKVFLGALGRTASGRWWALEEKWDIL